MKATVSIVRSFSFGNSFSKEWEGGDFKQFFNDEGEYLDLLCEIVASKGIGGDGFEIVYKVKVEK